MSQDSSAPDAGAEPQLAAGQRGHGGPALVMLWNESARVVDPHDYQLYTWADWSQLSPREGELFIQAVRLRLRVPEVITLTDYDRLPTAAVSFSRRNIFKRDHYTCQYCGVQPGSEELTIDHVIPRSQGGTSTWENCVLACVACNKRKADRTPQQAGMQLRKPPVRPTWKPLYAAPRGADRKLVEVHQRGVLERGAGEVNRESDAHGASSRPGPYTSVLLGEQAVSKAGGRGSTPRARACGTADVARLRKAVGSVNRSMLVRIQSSALEVDYVPWCGGSHGQPPKLARPGSIPGRATD